MMIHIPHATMLEENWRKQVLIIETGSFTRIFVPQTIELLGFDFLAAASAFSWRLAIVQLFFLLQWQNASQKKLRGERFEGPVLYRPDRTMVAGTGNS